MKKLFTSEYQPRRDRGDRVSNEPISAAIEQRIKQSGMTWNQLAKATDFADTTRVKRMLGLKESVSVQKGKVYRAVQTTIDYDRAVTLCLGAGLDPVDVGL